MARLRDRLFVGNAASNDLQQFRLFAGGADDVASPAAFLDPALHVDDQPGPGGVDRLRRRKIDRDVTRCLGRRQLRAKFIDPGDHDPVRQLYRHWPILASTHPKVRPENFLKLNSCRTAASVI